MSLSPFPFQGPLSPDDLFVRHGLVDDLVDRLTHRRVTALLSPRRFGKTSALQAVRARLEEAPTSVVVWLDLYELSGWGDLAIRLGDALSAANVRVDDRVASLAASMSLDLGLIRAQLTRPANQRPDPMVIVHSLLDVIVRLAHTNPVNLIIDEFSGIARVDGAAGLFRTKLQHSYHDIGLAFAGSEPSTMQLLFSDPAQPFYSQAEIVAVHPFTLDEVRQIVTDGFGQASGFAAVFARRIFDFADGHPQRSMQLADACWQEVEADSDRSGDDLFDASLAAVRAAAEGGSERHFAGFSTSEALVLRLIANDDALFGAAADLHRLSHSQAQAARRSLLDRGHLVESEGKHAVTDPVFADWVRRRFG